jgi:hypothetical protein
MEWIDGLADELKLDRLSAHETEHLLRSSRDVAHRIERRATPLVMYLLGLAAGRGSANGQPRDDALDEAVHTLILRMPEAPGSQEPGAGG